VTTAGESRDQAPTSSPTPLSTSWAWVGTCGMWGDVRGRQSVWCKGARACTPAACRCRSRHRALVCRARAWRSAGAVPPRGAFTLRLHAPPSRSAFTLRLLAWRLQAEQRREQRRVTWPHAALPYASPRASPYAGAWSPHAWPGAEPRRLARAHNPQGGTRAASGGRKAPAYLGAI
jgi:hypothetical protein